MHDDILRFLTDNNVQFTLHEHQPAVTVQDAEAILAFSVDRIMKTVAFRIKEGDWLLAAVRGLDRVDYRKLAAAHGRNRRDIVRPSAEEVEAVLGFQMGGVTPIALRDGIRVVFDNHTQDGGLFYCGAGRSDRTLELRATDLARATHAIIADIVQGE